MDVTGVISNISRCSLHDGPGIRTVIYLKGCALRCRWCHNPETLEAKPVILYAPVKCIHCGRCVSICPAHHVIQGNDMLFLRDGCARCGRCAENCPGGALSLCGEAMTPERVFAEIRKDAAYYKRTGGGVTLSGGECLLQTEFCFSLLSLCRDAGIHTAIETALFVKRDDLARVLPLVDFVFADLKIADREKHKACTGQYNDLIMDNLKYLTSVHGKVVIRVPMIPGVNDGPDDIKKLAAALDTLGPGAAEVELLRYNNLASSKYDQAGMTFSSFGEGPQNKETMETIRQSLDDALSIPRRVFYRM